MKKYMSLIAITAVMVAGASMNCYAAGWQHNQNGWWWQNEDASWPAASWQWLDGNGDGIAECYYFDSTGYMLAGTVTPDGFQVDSEGRWIVNGMIQTKNVGGQSGGMGSVGSGGVGSTGGTTGSGNNPYQGNRTVTGRYDITSSGEALEDAYYTPLDHTDVTAINDPDKYCELMNLYINGDDSLGSGDNWRVDWSKPVSESGQSNIYYYYNSFGDSRNQAGSFYKTVKVSKSRPFEAHQGSAIFEIRVYAFEDGYMLVNTTRNGIYFNERGEAVVNNAVVKHTNYCYYGDVHWHTTLRDKKELYWDDPIIYEGYPIFYHNRYMNGGSDKNERPSIIGYGFGDCCGDIYDFED